MDERLEVLSQVNNLDRFFIIHPPTPGLPHPDKTIYNSTGFIQWKENAKYQLRKLKPSETVGEIIDLLDSIKGRRDESDLKKLKAKIQIILDNPEDFLSDAEEEKKVKSDKLAKGDVVITAFDEYQLIKQIGQGGSGRVFSAKDSEGKDVAIKFVERDISTRKYKRLKNEINFCEKNEHKNIVHITDHGIAHLSEKDYVFYVMPLFPTTLEKKIKTGIEPDVAISIFIGIIQGLKFAHDKGIIHRDIKPENILFAVDSDEPVICDFGIAHFSEDELLTAVETKAGEKLANFQYAAPEQKVKGGATSVTARADVYAAGLILNEMFTGDIPQAGGYKTIAEIKPEYAFLDKLFNKLYQQKPDDRLFPPEKILNELNVLLENSNEERIKAELRNKTIPEVEVDFSISIIRKFYRDSGIVFGLDQPYPMEWFSTLVRADYSHRFVLGFEPERLYGADNNYSIVMPLKYDVNDSTLKTIVKYVYDWVDKTNKEYRNTMKRIAEKKRRDELEEIERQIKEAEMTQKINALLDE